MLQEKTNKNILKRKSENKISSYFSPSLPKKKYTDENDCSASDIKPPGMHECIDLREDDTSSVNDPSGNTTFDLIDKEISVNINSESVLSKFENNVQVSSHPDTNPRTNITLYDYGDPAIGQKVTYDIGNFINQRLDDIMKYNLITSPWIPPRNYKFPYSEHSEGKKVLNRYASHDHLNKYDWLIFSHVKRGYFCKYCSVFASFKLVGHNKNVPLKKLVNEPLTSFKRLFGLNNGYLTVHDTNKYHLEAIETAKDFLETYTRKENRIVNQIDNLRLQNIIENRKRLQIIVKTILFWVDKIYPSEAIEMMESY